MKRRFFKILIPIVLLIAALFTVCVIAGAENETTIPNNYKYEHIADQNHIGEDEEYYRYNLDVDAGRIVTNAGANIGFFDKDVNGNQTVAVKAELYYNASVQVVHIEGNVGIGDEDYNVKVGGETNGLTANSSGGARFGYENGKVVAKVSGGAEANLVEAKGSVGASLGDVEVKATGGVKVGIGATGEAGYEDGTFKCSVGVTLGVGFEIGVEIKVKDLAAPVKAVANAATKVAKWVGSWFG
ncbi:MAG: hypothetical protein CW338_01595 [Clostridiales bacterium]|nr:hypothetical protein [Clostridiales bacterium]